MCIRDSCEYWIDDPDAGLDYAMLKLSVNDTNLLKANGTIFYTPSQAHYNLTAISRNLFLMGFPEEASELADWQPGGETNIFSKPYLLPVFRDIERETGRYQMICGQLLNLHQLNSIVGMSGGPIFASIRNKTGTDYTLAGIQSSWIKRTGTIYATRIDSIVEHFWAWKKQNAV